MADPFTAGSVADQPSDPTPAYDPATDPTVVPASEIPTRPSSTDLQTNRVWREGDPDFDAASDSSATAQGNKYPQSYESAAAEANTADENVRRLEAELQVAQDVADAAHAKADYLKPDSTPASS